VDSKRLRGERRSVRKRGQNGDDNGKREAPFEAPFEAQGKQRKQAKMCCDKHPGE